MLHALRSQKRLSDAPELELRVMSFMSSLGITAGSSGREQHVFLTAEHTLKPQTTLPDEGSSMSSSGHLNSVDYIRAAPVPGKMNRKQG